MLRKIIKQGQSKATPTAIMKGGKEDLPATPLEVQTHLPLRTQEAGRTEYVAPVSNSILKNIDETSNVSVFC